MIKVEDKELLLKDLCSRIPYYIKGKVYDTTCTLNAITPCGRLSFADINSPTIYEVNEFKPYLFPLSSMTEEQKEEIYLKYGVHVDSVGEMNTGDYTSSVEMIDYFDYLNAHHFDYRELIEKGLAIDCTNLNIYGR